VNVIVGGRAEDYITGKTDKAELTAAISLLSKC
jgi:hypothetical protein